jgi:chromosome segregation ATPase
MNKILILCLLLTLFFYIFKQREGLSFMEKMQQMREKMQRLIQQANGPCNFNKSRDSLKRDVRDRNLSKHSPMWECGNWTEHPRDMEGNIGTYVHYRREQNDLIQHEINRLHSMRSDGNVNRSLDHKRSEVSNNKNKLRNMINDLTKKKNHIQKYYDDLDEKNDDIEKETDNLERKNELLRQYFKRLFF